MAHACDTARVDRARDPSVSGQRWTADDIDDQTGRVAVITGANSGIGFEIATVLAARGSSVVLACRNPERADAARARVLALAPDASVELALIDLSDLASVRRGATELVDRHPAIDLLVNNAGVLMTPHEISVDGLELQLATNHLGHFALTGLLLPSLLAAPHARVVTMTSIGHFIGRIDFEDLQRTTRYRKGPTYAQSKLANLLFAYELQRRFATAGVTARSLAAHPGSSDTDIARFIPRIQRALSPLSRVLQQSAAMGALPALRAATDPDARGGECFGPRALQWRGHPKLVRSSPRSHDLSVQRRLWEVSEELTGVTFELP